MSSAQSERYTKGAENGFAWKAMINPLLIYDDSKYNYLSGMLERFNLLKENYPAIEFLFCKDDIQKLQLQKKSDDVTLDYIVKEIDRFYSYESNMVIPIIFAYCYCIKESAGADSYELRKYRNDVLKFCGD
jgi:hypothetical protein